MKLNRILFILYLLCYAAGQGVQARQLESNAYKMIVEGFDWGPQVHKLILGLDEPLEEFDPSSFQVYVQRSSSLGDIPQTQQSGKRDVVYAYLSDDSGQRLEEGDHLTLVLAVSPVDPLGSAIQYMRIGQRASNVWIDYQATILHTPSGKLWNQNQGMIRPIVDQFDLSGQFTHQDISLSYASFSPKNLDKKAPLIIWLHGGGEGGSDPSIALMGNKAFNYASEEIQVLFGEGAHVLVPQAPTFWMQSSEGMTRGQSEDIYHEALFALFQDFVEKNPLVDSDRIYVGGCSNGGYMSLKLIFEHPEYFAAGYISALAYNNEYVSDAMIRKIKNVPIWFVHSRDDQVTKPAETVVPLFDRLKKAGAKNVHFSFYDHVTDITGFYGGEDFHYNGHWSWIYSHENVARYDLDGSPVLVDGRPVTLLEWMAAQSN
ncbi:prolyl oligopeptidase family serine peptidase [Algoriphagus namhaensis]